MPEALVSMGIFYLEDIMDKKITITALGLLLVSLIVSLHVSTTFPMSGGYGDHSYYSDGEGSQGTVGTVGTACTDMGEEFAFKPGDFQYSVDSIDNIKSDGKQENQDRAIEPDSKDIAADRYALFAVCDGHAGSGAAEYVQVHLKEKVLSKIVANETGSAGSVSVKQLFQDSFAQIDQEFMAARPADRSGTTVVAALLDKQDKVLHIANTGDSRAVLLDVDGKIVFITQDHKPGLEGRLECDDAQRYMRKNRFGKKCMGSPTGLLAVSRAIGDRDVKRDNPYLITTPDVTTIDIAAKDHILALASDGLWDVMSNEEVAAYVHAGMGCVGATAFGLTRGARTKDLENGKAKKLMSGDDVTVLLAQFFAGDAQ
jgi:serine/threonine protein phosphatase PrpC